METPKFDQRIETAAEKEIIQPKEIWIVDDSEDIARSALRMWQLKTKDRDYAFKHFETGRAALEELNRRLKEQEGLPQVIFVDGQLEKDEEDSELRKGANLIKAIRSMEDIVQPQLIAHSGIKENNDEMLAAGADLAFEKKEALKTAEFLAEYGKD